MSDTLSKICNEMSARLGMDVTTALTTMAAVVGLVVVVYQGVIARKDATIAHLKEQLDAAQRATGPELVRSLGEMVDRGEQQIAALRRDVATTREQLAEKVAEIENLKLPVDALRMKIANALYALEGQDAVLIHGRVSNTPLAPTERQAPAASPAPPSPDT